MADIEYFYSAHSAFAYLGSARFMEIARAGGHTIVHKPFDLGPAIEAGGAGSTRARSSAHRAYYFGREIQRWSEERNAPVIEQQGVAGGNILGKLPVGHAHPLGRAGIEGKVHIQHETISVLQVDPAIFKLADADFRTLQIDQNAHLAAQRLRTLAQDPGATDMHIRGVIRQVQAHEVGPGKDQPVEDRRIVSRGTERGNDFGSAHKVAGESLVPSSEHNRRASAAFTRHSRPATAALLAPRV